MARGLFRYDVTACETKVGPALLKFIPNHQIVYIDRRAEF